MYPHEFEFLWRLAIVGPSAAGEIAEMMNRPINRLFDTTPQTVGNQLRRLVKAGFVEPGEGRSSIYRLTQMGREYVDA